jgi:hypothetical protein
MNVPNADKRKLSIKLRTIALHLPISAFMCE